MKDDKPIVLGKSENIDIPSIDAQSNIWECHDSAISSFADKIDDGKDYSIVDFLIKHGLGIEDTKVKVRLVSSHTQEGLFANPTHDSGEYPLKDNPSFGKE
jgi:hypothetical protein